MATVVGPGNDPRRRKSGVTAVASMFKFHFVCLFVFSGGGVALCLIKRSCFTVVKPLFKGQNDVERLKCFLDCKGIQAC